MTTQTFHHTAMAEIEANTYAGWSYTRQRAARAILRDRMMAGAPVRDADELDARVAVKLGHIHH